MMKRILATAATTLALAMVGAAANADTCSNVSRAPAPCGMTCTAPVVDGNWVWLPSIGVPEAAWGFGTPGSQPSQSFGLPGASGNYVNDRGGFSWLLEKSICVNGNTARTTDHGVQSGCGF
jgi:hypothetical protein